MSEVEDLYPLSPLQQGLLFHSLYSGDAVYVEQELYTLHGDLDAAAFDSAWQELVARHPVLRTAFLWEGVEKPLQAVYRRVDLPLERHDWSALPAAEREARLGELLAADRRRPFDLRRAPLLRRTLVRTGPAEHRFLWSYHHLLLDGWSRGLLLSELLALYHAACRGAAPLRPRAQPYRDYIAWLGRQDLGAAARFWRQELQGFTRPTPLPLRLDHDGESGGAGHGAADLVLEPAFAARLGAFAREHRLTLNTLFQAAWALLLARHAGEEEVVFGATVSGRPPDLPGVEEMVGCFVNTVAVRVRAEPGMAPLLWLPRIQERQAARHLYEHTPLVEAQSASDVPRGLPLFETLFVFESFPAAAAAGDAPLLRIERHDEAIASFTHYPLELIVGTGAVLALRLNYDRQRLDALAAHRLLAHLGRLLAALLSPASCLAELPLATEAELHQVLHEWNAGALVAPPRLSALDLVAEQARRAPEAVAVSSRDGQLTYGELLRRARLWARALVRRGLGPGEVVAVLAERGADLMTALLAIGAARGVYLPLDPGHPEARWTRMLERTDARLVLCPPRLGERLPASWTGARLAFAELAAEAAGLALPLLQQPGPGDLAYVFFTSGSTGVPKGALIPQGAMLNHLRVKVELLGLNASDVVALSAPPGFDISIWQMLAALLAGGRVHVIDDAMAPRSLMAEVEQGGVTVLETVPSLLRALVEEADRSPRWRAALAGLRWMMPTGEALPPDLCRQWFALYPGIPLVNAYGPTECADDVAHLLLRQAPGPGAARVPVGRPIAGCGLYVVAEAWSGPAPAGIAGELCVGGVAVGCGYLGEPAKTAAAFVPHPWGGAGERLYRTGDRARLRADGTVELLGRGDGQVKVRGMRIELGEVEAVLRAEAAIADVAVLTQSDAAGDAVLVACVVLREGAPRELGAALRPALLARLPEAMVPARFVTLAVLPTTANGKLDREALADLAAAAAPRQPHAPAKAPRTPVEEVLAGIWEQVLGVERIGPGDDFFALGGHSLLAIRVASRVQAVLGVELPLRTLFEVPVLAGLARAVEALLAAGDRLAPASAPPLAAGPRDVELPLSFAQQRLWFLDRLEPGTPRYNIPAAVRLGGVLDVAALAAALAEVVRRHAALRTLFAARDGRAVQVIEPPAPVPLPLADLSALPEPRREEELARLAAAEALTPFDLETGPVLRLRLLRLLGPAQHAVLLTLHHIAGDAWSIGLLLHELAVLYRAFSAGLPSPLPELAVQYADFAVWQRQWLTGEVLERRLRYWKERLAGAPPALVLPTDRPRPALPGHAGGERPVAVPPPLADALRRLGRRLGATPFMVFLTAFQAVLGRWAGQEDVVVGVPVAGRDRLETEELIGLFVNTLALRTDLAGDPPCRALLARVREEVLAAHQHRELPFEALVEELRPERELGSTPLVQVLFVMQNAPRPDLSFPGLELAPLPAGPRTARFELSLALTEEKAEENAEKEAGFAGALTYRADLFDGTTASRLVSHFVALLASLSADPEQRLGEVSLLSAGERHQLLAEWNDTAAGLPSELCLHELFAAQAARTPEAPAVELSGASVSYRELEGAASRLARRLLGLGVGPDRVVGLCAERSPELIAGMLGILAAGGAWLPLDPDSPDERLLGCLREAAGAARPLLVAGCTVASRFAGAADVVILEAVGGTPLPPTAPLPPAAASGVTPAHLAYVIYTSGSTGVPKGVMVPHRGIVNRLLWTQEVYALGPGDAVLQQASSAFDFSIWECFAPLIAGARVVLVRPGAQGDAAYLAATIAERGVTVAHFTPSLLGAFLEQEGLERLRGLRQVLSGGEALRPAQRDRFFARLGPMGVALDNQYGPTETSIDVTRMRCEPGDPPHRVPLGRPMAEARLYVVNRMLRAVPVGAAGELAVAGAPLARGYLGRPELTAARFVPDPFAGAPGGRLYRTGDLARWLPDGTIEFLGRIDHQIKIRGFRIEPQEIEACLLFCPGVQGAAVVAQETALGSLRLVAYVVAEGVEPEAVRRSLARQLPDYMIPAAWVWLDELPLGPTGKLDRAALAAMSATRAARLAAEGGAAPRTPAERTLATIWQEVLGVERVGVHDNFFDLGGDSILSIQIVARAHAAGLRLTPRQAFEHQTVAQLAAAAEAAPLPGTLTTGGEEPPVVGEAPLTPIQRRFFAETRSELHHYNQAVLLEVHGEKLAAVLPRAVSALLAHHDALRLRFVPDSPAVWRQRFAPPEEGELPFSRLDLSTLPAGALRPALEAACALLQRSLDLARGPLARAAFFDRGSGRAGRLLVVAHHLVIDGVSFRILLEDLQTACAQLAAGEGVRLPPKTVSFARWAEHLAERARSPELRAQADYWLERPLAGLLSLPFAARGESSAAAVQVMLSADETRLLLTAVPEAYRTRVNDVLLTALARAVSGLTGDERLLVLLEGHGRAGTDLDLSRTVGWFTAVAPVLLDLRGAAGPGAALKTVKETLRRLPEGGVSYGLLRYLSGDPEVSARLAAQPEPQVVFNYLGQLDRMLPERGPLRPAEESAGPTAGRGVRHAPLEVIGRIAGEQLRLSLVYPPDRLPRPLVEQLGERLGTALRELIAHCLSPEAGGYTPSDFPLAALSQEEIDRLLGGEHGIEDVYPLSPLQQGLLFHALHVPESTAYFSQTSVVLRGDRDDLDVEAFRLAWQRMVDRHPALRTGFFWHGRGEPLQAVRRQVEIPWTLSDWSGLTPAEQEERLEAFLAADRARPFDFARPPLFRFALARLGPRSYRFTCSHHHLLTDGWSLSLAISEVLEDYGDLRAGRPPRQRQPRPFRDYIAWLVRQDPAASLAFWRRTLAGFATPTRLPDAGSAGAAPESFRQLRRELSAGTTAALMALCRHGRITPVTLLAGLWALLLGRTCGSDDVVFGCVFAGRPAELPGVESTVGVFINTLPVRVRIDAEAPLLPWLRALQQHQLELRQHEHTPLAVAAGASEVPRGQPLFDTLLISEGLPVYGSGGDGDLVAEGWHDVEWDELPLSLVAVPGQRLAFIFKYDRRRLDPALVTRLAGHLEILLAGAAGMPDARLAELPLLSPAERHQLVCEWNDSESDLAGPHCLHALFAAQAARTPDAPAVVTETGDGLSYRELASRAERLAADLARLGVGPEVRVPVLAERSLDMILALLGVLAAGGAYVPLDPSQPDARLAAILADSRPAGGLPVLLAQEKLRGRLPAPFAAAPGLDLLGRAPSGAAVAGTPVRVLPEHPAYVLYTSGSTGAPKGVVVSHRAICNHLLWMRREFPLTAADAVLQKTSFSFDASIWEIFLPLFSGARLVLAREDGHQDPGSLAQAVAAQGVTVLQLVPSQLAPYLAAGGDSGLRRLFLGGEALAPDLRDRALAALEAELCNLYGPTECAIDVLFAPCRRGAAAPPIVPLGRPLPNIRVHLLDPRLAPVPIAAPGEICAAGVGLARGYLGRPGLTAERFVPDPFSPQPGGRLYRTGDLGRRFPGGEIEFLGRIDRQLKIRGVRIEPAEVEAALCAHASVREAAVAADGRGGIAAFVVWRGGGEPPTTAALRGWLRLLLPAPMVPSVVVALSALPRTVAGKVDRRALTIAPTGQSGAPAPLCTPYEELLAAIWGEVLGVEQVGAGDDFFELGGHSLLATRVAARVREACGVEVALRNLFEAPVLADLARVVESAVAGREEPVPPIPPAPRDRDLPLSFAQQRLWFLAQLDPGSAAYNVAQAVGLSGPLAVPALAAAAGEVVCRHEVLRTRYLTADGVPVQRIEPPRPVMLPLVDLGALPAAAGESERRRLAAEEAQRPFDLERGPVLRLSLLRLAPAEHALLVTLHHIAADGWSAELLARELEALYAACHRGTPSPLPELPIQYADFAAWERSRLTEEALAPHLAYWRRRLGGDLPALTLPIDPTDLPSSPAGRGGRLDRVLPEALAAGLRALGRRESATPFMTLLAAFTALLSRVSGQDDVVIGADSANRPWRETEGLIGCFVNMLVLRFDVAGNPSFRTLLARVREVALGAYAHQDLPYDRLVEELAPLRRSPLFRVVFNFHSDLAPVRQPETAPPRDAEAGEALAVRPLAAGQQTVRFDLTLHVVASPGALQATWTYDTGLFPAATVERLHRCFETLLGGVVARPDAGLDELDILDAALREEEAERQRARQEAQREGLRRLCERRLEVAR